MALRYYANAAATTLAASCTSSSTSLELTSVSGLPIQYPYTLILDRGAATEEVVEVTNASGTTLTVTRGADSTTAFAHTNGAPVVHGISAQDPREANAHANATDGVHGVTGDLVGTTDTQELTNKTIGNSNTINGFTASKMVVTDGTGELTAGTSAPPSGAVVGTTDTQTLTNKDLSDASNTLPSSTVTKTGTQTLTNKTLTAPTINDPTIAGGSCAPDTLTIPDTVMQAGIATTGALTADTDTTVAVVFDTPMADATYIVQLTCGENVTSPQLFFATWKNRATTGFDIVARRTTGTGSFSVAWTVTKATQ